jgi:hypothetical protein
MLRKVRYQNVNWRGKVARRRMEVGDVKPRIRISVVSWRRIVMAGFMDIGKAILRYKRTL